MSSEKKNRGYIVLAVILGLVIIGIIVFALSGKPNAAADAAKLNVKVETDSMEHQLIQEVKSISGETVSSKIMELGKLVTADYYYTHAETFDSKKQALGITLPLTTTSFIYTVDGDIKAGIDFTKVTAVTDGEAKTIKITMPDAEIIASEIDHDSFQIVNQQSSIFNNLEAADVNATFEDVKQAEQKRAVENGLLQRASDNAVSLLSAFLKNTIGLEEYTVSFEPAGK